MLKLLLGDYKLVYMSHIVPIFKLQLLELLVFWDKQLIIFKERLCDKWFKDF